MGRVVLSAIALTAFISPASASNSGDVTDEARVVRDRRSWATGESRTGRVVPDR